MSFLNVKDWRSITTRSSMRNISQIELGTLAVILIRARHWQCGIRWASVCQNSTSRLYARHFGTVIVSLQCEIILDETISTIARVLAVCDIDVSWIDWIMFGEKKKIFAVYWVYTTKYIYVWKCWVFRNSDTVKSELFARFLWEHSTTAVVKQASLQQRSVERKIEAFPSAVAIGDIFHSRRRSFGQRSRVLIRIGRNLFSFDVSNGCRRSFATLG